MFYLLLESVLLEFEQYCNVDGQSGVFTVPCRAEPTRAGPWRARCYTELR
jgi:hypothetical protein